MDARGCKPVVGYIDGTWDLLHPGHVNIIQQARARCDWLVVGVATDELCARKKDKAPVMTFAEREHMVRPLCDRVIAHTALDETDLSFGPDLHFIGEDYGSWDREGDQTRRLQWCERHGIETIQLARTPGISTTELRRRIEREIAAFE